MHHRSLFIRPRAAIRSHAHFPGAHHTSTSLRSLPLVYLLYPPSPHLNLYTYPTISLYATTISKSDERNGWAYKTIDYIVFPTGLLALNDSLLLTVGRNDNSGWVVVLHTDRLVDSLLPVKSSVRENLFNRHAFYSLSGNE